MKVTFPYMGAVLIYEKLLQLFGHEVIVPPRPTQRTIDLGVKYSPEFACFPYKVLLGSYIEAIEMGADTVVTSGGSGPCRAGFYGEVHRKTLQELGYDVNFIVFDDIGRDPQLFLRNLRKVKGRASWPQTCRNVWTAYQLARAVDRLQRLVEVKRAYELQPNSINLAFEAIVSQFRSRGNTPAAIAALYRAGLDRLNAVPCREIPQRQRIRVGIVGEIYVVMESSINMNIAQTLNKLGCEVSRSMYISDWVDHAVWPKIFARKSGARLVKKSAPYLEIGIGGHERHNIGNIIQYREAGFDGVIHLMPFGCLPELVTQSLIPRIAEDWQIPVLTLALDEQSGLANNLTRVEAFVELLRSAKRSMAL
jgi:predicted nucleotide-binding protein (sugar kinase/HSP70/actin superfamily)